MARGHHWYSEPPWWAWVTMAVSLVAIAVMLPLALNRTPPDQDRSTRQSAPEPSSTPSPASPAGASPTGVDDDVTQVLVVGDVDTRGFAAGSQGWPAVLQQRLDGVELSVAATGDSGYATRGAAADPNFAELVQAADLTDVDVVVFFGSRFDEAGIVGFVQLGAGAALGAVAEGAPDAEIVVIGPIWPPEGLAPVGVRDNRDVVRAAARTVGAVFADPLAVGWFSDEPGLVAPDGVHLTVEADVYLADRIQPLIQAALTRGE